MNPTAQRQAGTDFVDDLATNPPDSTEIGAGLGIASAIANSTPAALPWDLADAVDRLGANRALLALAFYLQRLAREIDPNEANRAHRAVAAELENMVARDLIATASSLGEVQPGRLAANHNPCE